MKLIIAGGGTGGHLYPGIAVVELLLEKEPDSEVLFVGSDKELDSQLIQKEGYSFKKVCQKPFPSNRSPLKYFSFFVSFMISFFQAFSHLLRFKPDAILGMGGFSSVPTVLAGKFLGIKSVLFEPNLYPGKANRFLALFCSKIAVGFMGKDPFYSKNKVICTGIPVRSEISAVGRKRTYADQPEKFTVLVMGGSRGAKGINQMLTDSYSDLKKKIPALELIHITGKDLFEEVKSQYTRLQVNGEVELYPFVQDIYKLFERAQLIVARSGASSLAEFAASALPAILIPYPFSTQDHQVWNARYFERSGAGKMILEKDLSKERFLSLIGECFENRERLQKMSQAALSLNKEDSAEKLLALLTEFKKR